MTTKSYIDEKVAEFESFDSFFAGLSTEDEKRAMQLYEEYIRKSLMTAYSKGREDMLEEVLKELPPERIIHEYMKSQNTPENNAWNDYRNKTMKAIRALQSHE